MDGNVKYRHALTKAMTMCSQTELCRFDVITKLRHWNLSEEEITKVLNFLIKERFLDEERFVRCYVNDKLRFNKWGKVKLSFMLHQKQISRELINQSLNQIDMVFYEKTLHDLLQAKVKFIEGKAGYERKVKLVDFAKSHGFETELAFKVADQLIQVEES
jgi:regulatory protein